MLFSVSKLFSSGKYRILTCAGCAWFKGHI